MAFSFALMGFNTPKTLVDPHFRHEANFFMIFFGDGERAWCGRAHKAIATEPNSFSLSLRKRMPQGCKNGAGISFDNGF
jgi:hypothetical protein